MSSQPLALGPSSDKGALAESRLASTAAATAAATTAEPQEPRNFMIDTMLKRSNGYGVGFWVIDQSLVHAPDCPVQCLCPESAQTAIEHGRAVNAALRWDVVLVFVFL